MVVVLPTALSASLLLRQAGTGKVTMYACSGRPAASSNWPSESVPSAI